MVYEVSGLKFDNAHSTIFDVTGKVSRLNFDNAHFYSTIFAGGKS